jgi:hypothetical protein
MRFQACACISSTAGFWGAKLTALPTPWKSALAINWQGRIGSVELAIGKAPILAAAIDTDGRGARRPYAQERKAVGDPRPP